MINMMKMSNRVMQWLFEDWRLRLYIPISLRNQDDKTYNEKIVGNQEIGMKL